MRGVFFGMVILAVGAGATGARAGQVEFTATSQAGYDSNVFNEGGGQRCLQNAPNVCQGQPGARDAAVVRLGVQADARDTLERVSYRVHYAPHWFLYSIDGGKNDFNQQALAEGSYQLTPRTKVTGRDTFAYLNQIRPSVESTAQDIEGGDRRVVRNTAEFELQHLFTPRFSLYATGGQSIYRYNRVQDQDSDALSAQSSLLYALDQRTTVGLGGALGYTSFDNVSQSEVERRFVACAGQTGPGTHSFNYQGFASVSYRFDQNTTFRIQGGPARIETAIFSCQPYAVDPGPPPRFIGFFKRFDQKQTTWFGSGAVERKWRNVTARATYQRREGISAGNDTSSVNDVVNAFLTWTPARLWKADLRGQWTQRESQYARGSNDTTTTWQAWARIRRRVDEHLSATLTFTYTNQYTDQNTLNSLNTREFDAYRIFAGLEYRFAPVNY